MTLVLAHLYKLGVYFTAPPNLSYVRLLEGRMWAKRIAVLGQIQWDALIKKLK